MLFHVGALWRLNELGVLSKLDRISSVSGGSIAAGRLALAWRGLDFDCAGIAGRFDVDLVAPLRRLASSTIDIKAAVIGALNPRSSAAKQVSSAYQSYLFGSATLQDLPDRPRFVINASNLQSGVLWRFSKPYMRDYRVGEVRSPHTLLADAVAASSAFPPFLSPFRLDIEPRSITPNSGEDLQRPPFTTRAVLTDGGVYDNLGLEPVWKRYQTILVSDGGQKMPAQRHIAGNWYSQLRRVLDVEDNQVRSLRKRGIIAEFRSGTAEGTYWGIRTDIAEYGLADALACPVEMTLRLAAIPTRLAALDRTTQEQLINWGYAVCDAAMRRHVEPAWPAPSRLPYPGS